ncbi:Rha family transcriptional regulator [Pseudothauera rhizosphaerae]|uniref:Rha family transcriptional regulator n=1 Tax=Pseudothauera rhizosphaerae TaxID=2565932 RepID=UPI001B3B1D85|nr:Rha family transcriptional regulator [Pseudothauera rhizosphaerae]
MSNGNVMRDIRSMLEALKRDSNLNPFCKTTTYIGENGQEYEQYELDKDTCLTLLLGYEPVARMKVVKRWQELEAKAAPAQLAEGFANIEPEAFSELLDCFDDFKHHCQAGMELADCATARLLAVGMYIANLHEGETA